MTIPRRLELLLALGFLSTACIHTHVSSGRQDGLDSTSYARVDVAIDRVHEDLSPCLHRAVERFGERAGLRLVPVQRGGASLELCLRDCAERGSEALVWFEQSGGGREIRDVSGTNTVVGSGVGSVRWDTVEVTPWVSFDVQVWDVETGQATWSGSVRSEGPKEATWEKLATKAVEKSLKRLEYEGWFRKGPSPSSRAGDSAR